MVIVLAVGYWVYRAELVGGAPGGSMSTIVDQADLAGVKSDLISIGGVERLYLASHDSYATLDQLQQEGSIGFRSRHGYNFSVDVDGAQHFKVVAARPTHPKLDGRSFPSTKPCKSPSHNLAGCARTALPSHFPKSACAQVSRALAFAQSGEIEHHVTVLIHLKNRHEAGSPDDFIVAIGIADVNRLEKCIVESPDHN